MMDVNTLFDEDTELTEEQKLEKRILFINYINDTTADRKILINQFKAGHPKGLQFYYDLFVIPWFAKIKHAICWNQTLNIISKKYFVIHGLEDMGLGIIGKIPTNKGKEVYFQFVYHPYAIRSHYVPYKLLKKVMIYLYIFYFLIIFF